MHLIKSIHKEKDKFIPTDIYIALWFRIINTHIFDNALTPFEKVVIKDMKEFWACVTYDDEIKNPPLHLHIHTEFTNKLHFVNVLAHEMVHKWQMEINLDSGNHNKHFFSWREKFKENGLDLNRKA